MSTTTELRSVGEVSSSGYLRRAFLFETVGITAQLWSEQASDGRETEFPRHDCPVRQHTARFHHKTLRPDKQRHPRRVCRRADEDVTSLARWCGGWFS